MQGFHQGFQTQENWGKHAGQMLSLFSSVWKLWWNPHTASGIKENGNIHEFFTCYWQVCCYEKLYCYGDLHFEKGCEPCYHVLGNLNKWVNAMMFSVGNVLWERVC